MASEKNWRTEMEQVAEFLRDPFKMRMAVAGVTLIVMCFVINDPLQGRMKISQRDLQDLEAKVGTAQEIMLLRGHLSKLGDRFIKGQGSDVVVSYLIDIIRNEPVDLMRIDAMPPVKLGPLQTVRVNIEVTGDYRELIGLVHRLESDQYLVRIEDFSIVPPKRNRLKSMLTVVLQVMKEKS